MLAAYHERCSQRGVCRIFGIAKQTLTDWLKSEQLKSRDAAALNEDIDKGSEERATGEMHENCLLLFLHEHNKKHNYNWLN